MTAKRVEQSFNHRDQERALTRCRLDGCHRREVEFGAITDKVKDEVNNPPAGIDDALRLAPLDGDAQLNGHTSTLRTAPDGLSWRKSRCHPREPTFVAGSHKGGGRDSNPRPPGPQPGSSTN